MESKYNCKCIICSKEFVHNQPKKNTCSIYCKKERIKQIKREEYKRNKSSIRAKQTEYRRLNKEKLYVLIDLKKIEKYCKDCSIRLYEENIFLSSIKKKYWICNNCRRNRDILKYIFQRDKISFRNKETYNKNKQYYKEKSKEYYYNNIKNAKVTKKIYWQKKGKLEARKKHKERLKTDNIYALKDSIRKLISISIREKNYTKNSRTYEILGCDYKTFKKYLETEYYKKYNKKFNWEKRNLYHLDHKIPMYYAKTEEEVLKFNHYTNFQLLKKEENLSKQHYKKDIDLLNYNLL